VGKEIRNMNCRQNEPYEKSLTGAPQQQTAGVILCTGPSIGACGRGEGKK